jgi:hypothetical protein
LNNDLSVSGLHTYTAGMITTSATPNYLRYESAASYTGDGDSRHVNGWVRKTGNTNFTFPVGNGTYERTIRINSLGSSSVFNAQYAGATTNNSNLTPPLVTVNPNEYWILNRVSGGAAIVDMNWDNTKVPIPAYSLTDMRVANYLSSSWTAVGGSASGNIATTGNIASSSISSFGSFTIGSISLLVPMHLVRFSVAKTNGSASLTWSTTNEENLSEFQPQRSSDGINFKGIGSVTPHNLPGVQHYSLIDPKPIDGLTYYRLRTVDIDGTSTVSKIVTLDGTSAGYLTVLNPAHNSIRIASNNINGQVEYSLSTDAGQTIQAGVFNIAGTFTDLPLKSSLKAGMYILQVQQKDTRYSRKVIVR